MWSQARDPEIKVREYTMAARLHIRNPAEWAVEQVVHAGAAAKSVAESVAGTQAADPVIRRIRVSDLKDVLVKGDLRIPAPIARTCSFSA
jgi:hypothetical protein